MRNWLKYFNCIAMMVAWLVFANHCIITEAVASPPSQTEKSHHCHGHSDDDSKKDSHKSGHSGCKDEGCCQPALQSSGGSAQSILPQYAALPVILSQFLLTSYLVPLAEPVPVFAGTGPPGAYDLLISTLSQAPNAPPFTSIES